MGKSLIIILVVGLFALVGYSVYSALPLVRPQVQKIISWRPTPPSPTVQPQVTASPSATITTPTPTDLFANSLSITDYLQSKIGMKGFNGNVYCAYKVLDSSGSKPQTLYLLALCQEYYEKNTAKLPGTGIVVPVALSLKWTGEAFDITSHKTPAPGSEYETSLRSIFPQTLAGEILTDKFATDIKLLQQKVDSAVY